MLYIGLEIVLCTVFGLIVGAGLLMYIEDVVSLKKKKPKKGSKSERNHLSYDPEPDGYDLPPNQKVWTPAPTREDLLRKQDTHGNYLFEDALTQGLLTPNEIRELILGFDNTLSSEDAEKIKFKYIQESYLSSPIIMPFGITMSVTMLEKELDNTVKPVAEDPKPSYKVILDPDGKCHCFLCKRYWDNGHDYRYPGLIKYS